MSTGTEPRRRVGRNQGRVRDLKRKTGDPVETLDVLSEGHLKRRLILSRRTFLLGTTIKSESRSDIVCDTTKVVSTIHLSQTVNNKNSPSIFIINLRQVVI